MKTKKLTPRNAAPVQRENTATVSREGNGIAPLLTGQVERIGGYVGIIRVNPFAGDDAE
jgi:prenylated cyclic peptide (anacyclamide/piricyclamide family)